MPKWLATAHTVEKMEKGLRLTFRNSIDGNFAADVSISLLKAAQGSAQGAQKFKHDTRFKSLERRSRKWSGDVTVERLLDDIAAIVRFTAACLMGDVRVKVVITEY